MFIDSVTLTLSAGKGGNGAVAWRREKYLPKGGPTGGNGGRGGSIFLITDKQTLSLENYRNKRSIAAQNGQPGGTALKQGKSGTDLYLKVPCGTLVKNKKTGEVLFDLTQPDQEVRICAGGKGGKGNHHFKSPTNQAPHFATSGTPGETMEIDLELKLIADVGLVGMPNAGKSTLISSACKTRVKIAPYPFTTLVPNLGYITGTDGSKILMADIPGIIEKAHQNKGLGLSFLRHVERTSLLIFVIDISGFEERDPTEDFLMLRKEIAAYNPAVLEKPFFIALNKIDIEGADTHIARFYEIIDVPKERIFLLSAKEKQGLPELLQKIESTISPAPTESKVAS